MMDTIDDIIDDIGMFFKNNKKLLMYIFIYLSIKNIILYYYDI